MDTEQIKQAIHDANMSVVVSQGSNAILAITFNAVGEHLEINIHWKEDVDLPGFADLLTEAAQACMQQYAITQVQRLRFNEEGSKPRRKKKSGNKTDDLPF